MSELPFYLSFSPLDLASFPFIGVSLAPIIGPNILNILSKYMLNELTSLKPHSANAPLVCKGSTIQCSEYIPGHSQAIWPVK